MITSREKDPRSTKSPKNKYLLEEFNNKEIITLYFQDYLPLLRFLINQRIIYNKCYKIKLTHEDLQQRSLDLEYKVNCLHFLIFSKLNY